MNKKKNNKKGFDNEKYVKTQIETIKKRIKLFDNKSKEDKIIFFAVSNLSLLGVDEYLASFAKK